MRCVWWSSIVFGLVFCCPLSLLDEASAANQMPINASNCTIAAYDEAFQMASDQDSTLAQQRPPTGKLSRRGKAAQRRITARSEQAVAIDTSRAVLEAIRALPRDSSARIAQFKYVRTDKPAIGAKYHKNHPMFLSIPPIVKYQATLDSNRQVYRLSKTLDAKDTRIPTEIPMEDYSSLRLKQAMRQNWELITQAYLLKDEAKTTLGDLMGKITSIEVPIPKNPIFSIFGKNIIRMAINGMINIKAGFINIQSDAVSANPAMQNRTDPNFKQEIQVNVKGEIGDKLTIDADWNTQRTFEYENQLHVKYQGYEDEIVQSVEAGNVSLPTGSSFFGGGQALFGIKAQFQVGPLRLTTVATQKKGQGNEMTFTGGGSVTRFNKRPNEYSTNHYFIDESYIGLYEQMFKSNRDIVSAMTISEIEVWVTTTTADSKPTDRFIIAYMNQDDVLRLQDDSLAHDPKNITAQSGEFEAANFYKLEQNVDYYCDMNAGIISLITSLQGNQAIAVCYVVGSSNQSKRIGNPGQTQGINGKYIMKLVRPKDFGPIRKSAWKLQLKNRYSLGVLGVEKTSLDFRIEYEEKGPPGVTEVVNIPLLKLFGLDQYVDDNIPGNGDSKFDYIPNVTIDEKNGEIIFPTVEPFDTLSIQKFLRQHVPAISEDNIRKYADSLSYSAIYDTSANIALNNIKNRYYLRGSVKGAVDAAINLKSFNIVEGSVVVISGGQTLTPNVDYTVDYITGRVLIKNQTYLAPGRDLQIKYESADLFQLASKSLIGVRGELNLGKSSALGFTIMNYNQQSLSDKVRLGEEPISNTIMGMDGKTTLNTPWLTNALNFLPGIKTTAASQISLGGEAAYMLPNPNTRKSPIPSDGSKGAAYIDDFEGARQIIPLGVSYGMWKEASAPWYSSTIDSSFIPRTEDNGRYISTGANVLANGEIASDSVKMTYKARASWFNIFPSDVLVPTIWEKKTPAAGEGEVTVLNFLFRPAERGAYNYGRDLEKTIGDNSHTKAWAGIQHVLGTASDLIEQNVAFVELWINVVAGRDSSAKLNIDLGDISEDVIPDRNLTSEDRLYKKDDGSTGTSLNATGILNPDFDFGLDAKDDGMETAYADSFIQKYPQFAGDPAGDNWKQPASNAASPTDPLTLDKAKQFDNGVGGWVNGTQGNHLSEEGQFPDGEDFNRSGNPDLLNAYFEYEIPLDPKSEPFGNYVTGSNKDSSWLQVRIPLSEYKRKIGDPTFANIQGVRMWVTGARQEVLFRIVEFNLVGNQWEKLSRTDSSYEISVVNVEDNPNYRPPTGVEQQRDPTRPTENILGNEQSLNLIVKNLRDGQSKEVVKNSKERPLNMFNYRTLKMFVHGEEGLNPVKYRKFEYEDTTKYDAEMFLRFGTNFLNYYEYRAPVHSGWSGNEIIIKFADLTAIKALPFDTTTNMSPPVPVPGGHPGARYQIRGSPTLGSIQFISIGIENPAHKASRTVEDSTITGELWVNELRLTDVDDTPGWAYNFSIGVNFADIGRVNFSFTKRDPFFHEVDIPFGSRVAGKNWNLGASLSLHKFLPESWSGTSLELSYTHSESINNPRYLIGSDILTDEAAKAADLGAADTSRTKKRDFANAEDVRLHTEDLSTSDTYTAQNLRINVPLKTWLITETINKMTVGYNYTESYLRNPGIEYKKDWSWTASFRYGTQFNTDNYISPFSIFGDFFILRPWKNFKIFFTPKQINFGATLTRVQLKSRARTLTAIPSLSRSLNAQRSMDFNWQFFEGGLLDFGVGYSVSVSSTLQHLETDRYGNIRPFRSFFDILSSMFFGDRLINFGTDLSYTQAITFKTKVAAPQVLKLNEIFTPSFSYGVNYSWTNSLSAPENGRDASWNGGPSITLDINLKPIKDMIWSSTTTETPADTGAKKRSGNPIKQLSQLTGGLLKFAIFDFEKFNISFTQSNSSRNTAVRGSTGFANIFARVPFFQPSLPENGPSLLYQLGFISDPNGWLVLKTKNTFPFITGYTVPGIRASIPGSRGNVSITDNYTQNNQISLQTSRPLWDGANLTLNWRVGWIYDEGKTGKTDSLGYVIPSTIIRSVNGSVDRSYLSLPPMLMFKFLKSSIENVNVKYEALKKQDPNNLRTTVGAKMSQAFEEGLEVFPWLTKVFGQLAPRANWSIKWDGLEKFLLFKSFASSVSLDHAYASNYTRNWNLQMDTKLNKMTEVTLGQTVMYGFSPLVGLSIKFKEFIKGNMSANFQYRTSTSYSLDPGSQKTDAVSTSDISFSLSYNRQGFEIPLFGVSLMNNIDISISYGYSNNEKTTFDFARFQADGTPGLGSSTTKIEPKITYSLSERVTASLYYRHTKVTPGKGGGSTAGSTTTEGGVDLSILIK